MSNWSSVEEVLDFAIREEQKAADFYTELAQKVEDAAIRETLTGYAKEEMRHKAKLEALKDQGVELHPSRLEALDLKVAEYTVDIEARLDMSYPDLLILAMKKEKAAHDLYTDLAASATDGNIKEAFLMLAQEESNHKLHFEAEYDDQLTEN